MSGRRVLTCLVLAWTEKDGARGASWIFPLEQIMGSVREATWRGRLQSVFQPDMVSSLTQHAVLFIARTAGHWTNTFWTDEEDRALASATAWIKALARSTAPALSTTVSVRPPTPTIFCACHHTPVLSSIPRPCLTPSPLDLNKPSPFGRFSRDTYIREDS